MGLGDDADVGQVAFGDGLEVQRLVGAGGEEAGGGGEGLEDEGELAG